MRLLRGCCRLGLFSLPFLLVHGQSPAQLKGGEQDVQVKLVKYEEMGDVIRQLKGKVLVVDFWSTTCPPCMAEFPNLVKLNAKYGDKGFAAVSVSVDSEPDEANTQKQVLSFLRRSKAAFTNLLLNETADVWNKKLGNKEVPIVFVFNRDGKWVRKYTDDVDYGNIEKLVVELLKEK
jgi:thiol-disulfide isomerase/thioredoxin